MSRSYKKFPMYKGDNGHRYDKKMSTRMYRGFVRRLMNQERYDDIHGCKKHMWDKWCWSPDYFIYFGDYLNRTDISYYSFRHYPEKTTEELVEEHKKWYADWYRKYIRK